MTKKWVAASAAVCAAVATTAALATGAQAAGTYHVYSCRGPAGNAIAAAGWAATRGNGAFAEDDCAAGGTLGVGLTGPGPWDGSNGAEERFAAPSSTAINSLTIARATSGLAPPQSGLGYRLEDPEGVLERCDPGQSACDADLSGTFTPKTLSTSAIDFRVGCFEAYPGTCTGNGAAPRADVSQAVIGLADSTAPVVKNVRGTLTDPAAAGTGSLGLTFDAADTGGGLYRVITSVDSNVVDASDLAAGTCADAGPADADPYEFTTALPCPLSINAITATLDTTKIPNGTHTVDVVVEDAAGNRTAVQPTRKLVVDNPTPPGSGAGGGSGAGTGPSGTAPGPVVVSSQSVVKTVPLNGINADIHGKLTAYFVATHKRTATSRYGRRVVVRGRLVNSKRHSIQGARIDVYHRIHGHLKELIKTGLKTRKDGRITLILPLNLTSREIVLAYRAKRPGPITSRQTLKLTVRDKHGKTLTELPSKKSR